MKHSSLSVVALSFILALTACEKKSEESSSEHADHAEAAVSEDDSAFCETMPFKMGLHGDLEGYTKSAQGLFHVKVDWSSPLTSGTLTNQATVTFVNDHEEPLPLKLSSFKLFMPAMGHGSGKTDQLVVTQDAANPNIWTLDKIYFSMGGGPTEWVVDIEGGACGASDKARVAIPVEVQ